VPYKAVPYKAVPYKDVPYKDEAYNAVPYKNVLSPRVLSESGSPPTNQIECESCKTLLKCSLCLTLFEWVRSCYGYDM
jgi:hypothetical protein